MTANDEPKPICPDTVEECAKGYEALAKYKSKVASDALRQAAKQMRERIKEIPEHQ